MYRQIRCYNCGKLGRTAKDCYQSLVGQNLNYRGPIGRAEMRLAQPTLPMITDYVALFKPLNPCTLQSEFLGKLQCHAR